MSKVYDRESKEYILPHTNGLEARIILTKLGQLPPYKGDEVEFKGSLQLPVEVISNSSNAIYNKIHPLIRFSDRIHLLDMPLDSDWGSSVTDETGVSYRERSLRFVAPTWRKAREDALTAMNYNLIKLINALEDRHRALLNADGD